VTASTSIATYHELAVDKATGTHADVFAVAGLADLLASTLGDTRVHVRDDGQRFVVTLDEPLTDRDLGGLAVQPGYPYLRARRKDALPQGVDAVDFEAERERAKRYAEIRKALRGATSRKTGSDPELIQSLQETQPRDDWRLLQVMYMLTNHVSPNRVHATIVALPAEERQRRVAAALRALAEGERERRVPWKADSVQLFNPTAAKGYARLKPDGTDRNDKTKEQWTDDFVEWLRYRGYFRVACPVFQGPKNEHIRLYTPIPANASLAVLKGASATLRRANLWGGAPKVDALAVIGLADYLIRNSDQGRAVSGAGLAEILDLSLEDLTPAEVIAGVAITHYQSLGSARAVSSISTLAIPGWFPVHSPDDARAWIEILDEHRRVVRGLDDSHSDEIGLLIGYRRFLERRGPAAVGALLDFMGSYGQFLVRAWDAKRRVRAFRTTNVRRLLEGMAPSFADIVADPGFEAIARAIRRATVQAQFLKSNGARDLREIRYDLIPELRRARTVPDSRLFVEAVADFVTKYNAENARRRELRKQAPANVHTDEFARFLHLVDEHGANVVGALLCAYGTCVEPREVGGDENADDDQTDSEPEPTSSNDLTDSTTSEES
jgi:hypothetical protein